MTSADLPLPEHGQGEWDDLLDPLLLQLQRRTSAVFIPEDFASGLDLTGPTADAQPAIQAAIDAAADDGGGVVQLLPHQYVWDGDITQKTGVDVRGPGTSAFGTASAGLKALADTARYRYGNLSGNPYPGTLSNLLLDGDDVGGATQLLRIEAVDSAIRDVAVVRGAGDGVVFAGAQNVIADHLIVSGFPTGAAVAFRNKDATALNTQGAGDCKLLFSHITSAYKLLVQDYIVNDVGELLEYWPHDNMVDHCILEQYLDDYFSLVHLADGDLQLTSTFLTGSSGDGPAEADCIVLVENEIRPTSSTILNMANGYMGGGAAHPTDGIRSNSYGLANSVFISGHTVTANTDYILCDDRAGGGAGVIGGIDGHLQAQVGQVVSRGINGGVAGAFTNIRRHPTRFQMDDDQANPIQIRRDGESNRFQVTRDGNIQWLNGDDPTIRANIIRSGDGVAINGHTLMELYHVATALRPDPTTVPYRMLYDTDLKMPMWSDGVAWYVAGDSNIVGHAERSAAGTAQTIPNGSVLTTITWPTSVVAERGGLSYAAGVFTCTRAGRFALSAYVELTANANGRRRLVILKNAAIVDAIRTNATANGSWEGKVGVDSVDLAVGDTLQVQLSHDSPTTPLAVLGGYVAVTGKGR